MDGSVFACHQPPNGRGPASQSAIQLTSNSSCSASGTTTATAGEWAMARGANPNVTLPHRVAPLQHRHVSWEACRSAHRLPASERLDAPKVSQGALESGPETVKKWTRLADQRGLLDARAICFQTSPPPTGADSVGRSPEAQFRHVHASASSHPVDVDPAAPRLPQITGSQSSCQLKSPHHHRPLIVQCVPVSQCGSG